MVSDLSHSTYTWEAEAGNLCGCEASLIYTASSRMFTGTSIAVLGRRTASFHAQSPSLHAQCQPDSSQHRSQLVRELLKKSKTKDNSKRTKPTPEENK